MQKEILDILTRLVSFKTDDHSQNQNFDACGDYISNLFKDLGFDVKKTSCEYGNIISGIFNSQKKYPQIHFNGHYDTVPIPTGDRVAYNETNGIFTGRGCSDMKAGIISVYLACRELIKQGGKYELSFSFVPDEEIGGIGSHECLSQILGYLKKDAIIIIADSSYPNLIVSHNGAIWLEVQCCVSHDNRFAEAMSAFDVACTIYNKIKTQLNCIPGIQNIVGGGICKSSGAFNVFPCSYSFSLDVRYADNDYTKLINKISDIIRRTGKEFEPECEIECLQKLSIKPVLSDCENFLGYLNCVKSILHSATIIHAKGFYDLAWFRENGFCESFVLGPGDIRQAHVPNEKLDIRNIIDISNCYVKIARRYCDENK